MAAPLIVIAVVVGILLLALLMWGYARKDDPTNKLEDEVRDWKVDAHSRW
jgi:nitrogen fixation-related uncharacterized protein